MASPHSLDDEPHSIDPSEPFRGIVVCCTSIPPEQRTDIGHKAVELGGLHKYDLTPEVTHLVVGDYDTPKYRHTARERPDIKVMDPAWVDAVAELWRNDEDMDFAALEREYQLRPLEKGGAEPVADGAEPGPRDSLLICLTGFGDQREDIADKITANGGSYTGDLTRKCSHLIVSKPEGKKFVAAKSWGVLTVTLDWLLQSIERGMILEETRFDPMMPPEEQGVGAWTRKDPRRTSLGKRSRSAISAGVEEGGRKLRKTASMKLNSQRNNLWGDILGRSTSRQYSFAHEQSRQDEPTQAPTPEPHLPTPEVDQGVFGNCVFFIHGFNQKRTEVLQQTITTLGGISTATLEEAALSTPLAPQEPSHRFLIVPQTSQPDTHPSNPHDNLHVVTEFYIERCLHNKRFSEPRDHTLGHPFPLFPIPGFAGLSVCSAAFTGLELNQVARSVAQLGAQFDEEFRRSTSVLVCKSLSNMRKEKLRYALDWNVPVVSADWLWDCIVSAYCLPMDDYIFPELKDRYASHRPASAPTKKQPDKQTQQKNPKENATRPLAGAGVDTTGFDRDTPEKTKQKKSASRTAVAHQDSTTSADFATARTQQQRPESLNRGSDSPLTELSSASLNKSPSPAKHAMTAHGPSRIKSDPNPTASVDKHSLLRAPSAPPRVCDVKKHEKDQEQEEDQEHQRQQAEELARQEDEENRKQTKAAERLALTSKITSLIDSTTAATPSLSTANSTNDQASAAASTSAAATSTSFSKQGSRPRRQILGRAISIASNGSAASNTEPHPRHASVAAQDSIRAAAGDEKDGAAPDSETLTAAGGPEGGADGDDGRGGEAPPATQLEYRDPKAQECKAALMNRMMSEAGGAAEGPSAGGRTLRKR